MPSGKTVRGSSKEKSKEDTWGPDELSKYTQGGSKQPASLDRRDASKNRLPDKSATTPSRDSKDVHRPKKTSGTSTSTSDRRHRAASEERTTRGRSTDRETKEEVKRREKKDVGKKTEETRKTEKSTRPKDSEVKRRRDGSVGKARDLDASGKRDRDKSERQKTTETEAEATKPSEASEQNGQQKPQPAERETISKPVDTADTEKKPHREHKRSDRGKRSKHAREIEQQDKPRAKIERKRHLQHPEANRLDKLSPERTEGSAQLAESHKDNDRKVKRRERELMAALAMEEHQRKMQQRKRFLDEMADTDSDPDIRRSDGTGPGPLPVPPIVNVDDEIVSDTEEVQNRDDYADEEFESYDDDFENDAETDSESDDEGLNLQEVMQAIQHENKHIRSASHSRQPSATQSTGTTDQSRESPTSPTPSTKTHGRMIFNFVSASKQEVNEQVARKTKKRGEELLKLIEFDFVAIDMLDLAPQSEYDVYMKSYGRANTAQAYVQTNEDNMDQEIQTDEIEEVDKWTQHPPEDLHGCGGTTDRDAEFEALTTASHYNPFTEDSIRLSKFLQRASQVCSVLLEENIAEVSQSQNLQRKTEYSFSSGFSPLGTTSSAFAGRYVQSVSFSPIQTNLLLTAFSAAPSTHDTDELFTGDGVVCVWNLNEPSMPDKVLTCQSLTTCCCFSPNKASLAFGGTEDGSVVVWDLRESAGMHRMHRLGDREWIIRSPTYSTAGISTSDNHHSAICSICSIASSYSDTNKSRIFHPRHEDAAGLSFQLASLDENGNLNIWVVIEMSKPDAAGSESDLGLVPGGRVKLIKSTSIVLQPPPRLLPYSVSSIRTYDVQFLPSDPNHFYTATNLGCVLHGVRYGGKGTPRAFRNVGDSIVDVKTVDLSPFSGQFLLAGCSDGSLRLYSTHRELPILMWSAFTRSSEITCVRWSRSRPHVFYVLTSTSVLHIWDLQKCDSAPVASHKSSQGKLIAFGLSNDHVSLGIGLPGRQAEMVLTFANGSVENHIINEQLSICQPDEVTSFINYLYSCL